MEEKSQLLRATFGNMSHKIRHFLPQQSQNLPMKCPSHKFGITTTWPERCKMRNSKLQSMQNLVNFVRKWLAILIQWCPKCHICLSTQRPLSSMTQAVATETHVRLHTFTISTWHDVYLIWLMHCVMEEKRASSCSDYILIPSYRYRFVKRWFTQA